VIAVHNDVTEARAAVAVASTGYAGLTNYQRIIEAGSGASPADVAIIGDETAVKTQLEQLICAGATDV
jgi:hypothetical protein